MAVEIILQNPSTISNAVSNLHGARSEELSGKERSNITGAWSNSIMVEYPMYLIKGSNTPLLKTYD